MSNHGRDEGVASANSGSLRKGQACVCCRRRKQRCDGAHPICSQCSTSGRQLDCEYSDGFAPTRTEILQGYLARLQSRVDTLENTPVQQGQATGPSLTRQGTSRGKPPSLLAQPSTRWWEAETPPPQVSRALLDNFFQHAYQVGWSLNSNRILTNLSTPPSSPVYPHLGLVNVIFLWGAHFALTLSDNTMSAPASPQMQAEVEHALLNRARSYLQTQLDRQSPRMGLHAVQAEVLLSTYLFAMGGNVGGRTLETEYHVNAAVSLALGYGMTRIVPQAAAGEGSAGAGRGADIHIVVPPVDAIEEGERIAIFWRVFCLDRLWAIAQGRPSSSRLEGDAKVVISTPWPVAPDAYEQRSELYSASRMSQPLKQFLEEQGNSTSGFDYPALAVKACFLCERAFHFATRPSSDADNRATDVTIFSFVSTLAPLDGGAPTSLKARFVSIHATAYLSFVRLHERNAPTDPGAYARCVQAARYVSTLLGHLGEEGIVELDPLVMPCFIISCKVLMREIVRTRQAQAPQNTQGGAYNFTPQNVLVAELDLVMSTLSSLEPVYPVIVSQLDSLQEMRANMRI